MQGSFLDYALETPRRFVFFGGKGGVGKTTSAVACALYLAEHEPHKKVLLVSTDPAHSVGDCLNQPIGDQIVQVRGVENLFSHEADAKRLLAEFKIINGPVLTKIADRGTYFDKDDIRAFWELSLPGLDEFMAILELIDLAKIRQYDIIVMDTAPTGHTIRLLELPGLLQQWIGVLDLMMHKHRVMAETFTRGHYRPDECDRWLDSMAGDAKRVEKLLQDPAATEFVVVTIPEEMAVAESERLVAALKRFRISVRNLIVNHVVTQDVLCPFCRQRRDEQADSLKRIERAFADLHILHIPQLPYEVRGLDSLHRFAGLFTDGERPNAAQGCEPTGADAEPTAAARASQYALPLLLPTARLILIGGKGGVGKSTIAAATAIEIAARYPEKKVLIFSTDPAHSLSDSFGQRIGTAITIIDGFANLSAQEIDAPKLLVDFKRRYRKAINDIFNSFLSGSDINVAFEQEVMERLLDLSPPGIDELMALVEVMELMEGKAFDIVVLDTAPTGHLLRFLEMPEIAGDWLAAAMKVILKYQGLVSLGSIAGLVMKYSSQVRRLRRVLLEAAATEIIVVTIPEALGVVEMRRLLDSLRTFKIACRQIVVNMVTPSNACVFCTVKREEEQRYVREVIAECLDHRIDCVPRLPHPIHGMTDLLEFRHVIWGAVADSNHKPPGEVDHVALTSAKPSIPNGICINGNADVPATGLGTLSTTDTE
jgi:arsenite/tail-anchored protein-transporting ATPase